MSNENRESKFDDARHARATVCRAGVAPDVPCPVGSRWQIASHRRQRRRVAMCVLAAATTFLWAPSAPAQRRGSGVDQPAIGYDGPVQSHNGCAVDEDCPAEGCLRGVCQDGQCVQEATPGCVPCTPGYICPEMEVVFLLDTSGSMGDEAEVMCASIDDVQNQLLSLGITVTAHFLGITDTGKRNESFSCLSTDVVTLLGPEVPNSIGIDPSELCDFPGAASSFESWGPGTAIVAGRFDWMDGVERMIVPMGDEGPCNGDRPDGCNDPGDDRNATENAGLTAIFNDVTVSPITGSGAGDCVVGLARLLATGTGGTTIQVNDARADIPDALLHILLDQCVPDLTCDDANMCTDDDTCENGVCAGTANFDPAVVCCNPADRTLTELDDGDPCTDDVCDPATGIVNHPPAEADIPCDDGDDCTAVDVCDGAGGCDGADINSFSCTSEDDCFGALCNVESATCFCTPVPTLSLDARPGSLPGTGCYTEGDDIFVDVHLGWSVTTVTGGDFLIDFSPEALEVIEILPGSEVDPSSPFEVLLFSNVDDVAGMIAMAVGVQTGEPGTRGPALMATIHMRAASACTSDQLCFLTGHPLTTLLTTGNGGNITFIPRCTLPLSVNGTAPSLDCPQSVQRNADPGLVTAAESWEEPRAISQCDGTLELSCASNNDLGADVAHLLATGGIMPAGTSTFRCSVEDSCGADASCEWAVTVRQFNQVEVDVELSPQLATDVAMQPLQRCIEFEFYPNCVQEPITVSETISFGLPLGLPGHADSIVFEVPAGAYDCVTARDPRHTLRSVSSLEIIGDRYVGGFVGDPFFGGNWLVGGNLDGNGVIDILDYGILLSKYLQPDVRETPCGFRNPNADLNGDGQVDILDMSFLARNFLASDKGSCCPDSIASTAPPRTRVSVQELREKGLDDLANADVDGDGIVDLGDLGSYFRTVGRNGKR